MPALDVRVSYIRGTLLDLTGGSYYRGTLLFRGLFSGSCIFVRPHVGLRV